MAQNELDVGERQRRIGGHPAGRSVAQRMQRGAGAGDRGARSHMRCAA
jgi:hypothetical protein